MEEAEYAYIRCFGGALNNSVIQTQVIAHMMPFINSITLRSNNNHLYRYVKVDDVVDSNFLPVFIKMEKILEDDPEIEPDDYA